MTFIFFIFSRIFNGLRLIGLPKHQQHVKEARKIIKKLKKFEHDGSVLNYLRQINPLVFEELVLCLFEVHGIFIFRGRSYSNDGGVDGVIYWPKKGRVAIQCKRYSKSITPAHARDFKKIALTHYQGGIFAHTGRTGEMSQDALHTDGLFILSGSDLILALRGISPIQLLEERAKRAKNAKYLNSKKNSQLPISTPSSSNIKKGNRNQ